jgi:hypothetical protein
VKQSSNAVAAVEVFLAFFSACFFQATLTLSGINSRFFFHHLFSTLPFFLQWLHVYFLLGLRHGFFFPPFLSFVVAVAATSSSLSESVLS